MPIDLVRRFVDLVKTASFLIAIIGSAFSITLCGIGIGGYLAGLLMEVLFCRKDDWLPFPRGRFVLPLLVCLAVSVFISDYLAVSLRGFWKYLEGFILLYAGLDVLRDRTRFRWAFSTLVVVFLIAGLDGIFQDLLGRDLIYFRTPVVYQTGIFRVRGPFKHPNDYATFLIPGLALFLAVSMHSLRRRDWPLVLFFVSSLAVLVIGITRSMSRAALLSAFACLIFYSLFHKKRFLFLILAALGLAAMFFVPSTLSLRMREVFDSSAGNMPERLLLLKTAWAMVRASPFFGLGLNTYSDHFAEFRPAEYGDVMYAHNSYLQMATEAGLVGLFFYLLLIGALLVAFLKGIRKAEDSLYKAVAMGFVAGMVGFLVNCLFDSCFQSTQLRTIFWLVMGMVSALTYRSFYAESARHPRGR